MATWRVTTMVGTFQQAMPMKKRCWKHSLFSQCTPSSTCVFEISFAFSCDVVQQRTFFLGDKRWIWTIVNAPKNSTRMTSFWKWAMFCVYQIMNCSKDESSSCIQTITWIFTMNAEIKNGLCCFQNGFFEIEPCDFIYCLPIFSPMVISWLHILGNYGSVTSQKVQNATWTVLSSIFIKNFLCARSQMRGNFEGV